MDFADLAAAAKSAREMVNAAAASINPAVTQLQITSASLVGTGQAVKDEVSRTLKRPAILRVSKAGKKVAGIANYLQQHAATGEVAAVAARFPDPPPQDVTPDGVDPGGSNGDGTSSDSSDMQGRLFATSPQTVGGAPAGPSTSSGPPVVGAPALPGTGTPPTVPPSQPPSGPTTPPSGGGGIPILPPGSPPIGVPGQPVLPPGNPPLPPGAPPPPVIPPGPGGTWQIWANCKTSKCLGMPWSLGVNSGLGPDWFPSGLYYNGDAVWNGMAWVAPPVPQGNCQQALDAVCKPKPPAPPVPPAPPAPPMPPPQAQCLAGCWQVTDLSDNGSGDTVIFTDSCLMLVAINAILAAYGLGPFTQDDLNLLLVSNTNNTITGAPGLSIDIRPCGMPLPPRPPRPPVPPIPPTLPPSGGTPTLPPSGGTPTLPPSGGTPPTPPPSGGTPPPDQGGATPPPQPPPAAVDCPCPLISPQAPAPSSQWTERTVQLKTYLVKVGTSILAKAGYKGEEFIDPCEVWGLSKWLFGAQGLNQQTLDRIQTLLASVSNCDTLQMYLGAMEQYLCGDIGDLQALLAVRATLISWQQAAASWHSSSGSGVDASLHSPSIGQLVPLSLGLGMKADDALAYSQSINIALVPALQTLDQLIASSCPQGIPGIAESIDLYVHARVTAEELQLLIVLNNGRWDVYRDVLAKATWQLSVDQAIMAVRLQGGDETAVAKAMAFAGYSDPAQQAAHLAIYDRPLTPAECIADSGRFFNANVVISGYGFEEGFADSVMPLHGAALAAQGITRSTALTQWQLHWQIPSPFILADWCFRLSAGFAPPGAETTWADFDNLLSAQGYTKWFRDRFRATAYQIPSVRQHASSVAFGQYTIDDVQSALARAGYVEPDITKLGNAYYFQGLRRGIAAAQGFTAPVVFRLLVAGAVKPGELDGYLLPQGYTQAQIDELTKRAVLTSQAANDTRWQNRAVGGWIRQLLASYQTGAIDTATAVSSLQALNMNGDVIALMVKTADLATQTGTAKRGIAAVQHSMLIGAITYAQATNALVVMGIALPRAQQYATQWAAQLTFPRRVSAAAEIQGWASSGLLPISVAADRLAALGFDNQDIALKLSAIGAKIQKAKAAADTASKKAAVAAAKQAAQAAKQAAAVITQAQAIHRRYWSIARTTKLYSQGVVSEKAFRRQLAASGYDQEEIDVSFAEAQIAKAAVDAKSPKSGADTIRRNGPPVE